MIKVTEDCINIEGEPIKIITEFEVLCCHAKEVFGAQCKDEESRNIVISTLTNMFLRLALYDNSDEYVQSINNRVDVSLEDIKKKLEEV